jgi:uncharacterized cupin superfamily protein
MEDGVSFAALDHATTERFVALRRELGVSTFGINQMALARGQRGRIHAHKRQEEVYVVLAGELTLIIEGVEHTMAAGQLARVAPAVRRQLANRGEATCVLLALGGAEPHAGRDATAWAEWDSTESAAPQDVPLPADLPLH